MQSHRGKPIYALGVMFICPVLCSMFLLPKLYHVVVGRVYPIRMIALERRKNTNSLPGRHRPQCWAGLF